MTCTLRAEAHHPPCVLSAGFCTEHSAKARGIGYEEEKSPTLRAGVVPATISCYENHSQDTRYRGPLDVAPTVSATYGSGGNNQPFVVNAPVTLKIRSGCEGGGKGAIWQEDKSATLSCNNDQTLFAPKAYGISAFESNAMKSDNPHSGVYEADTSRTLDCGGGSPACNQGGMAIVESYSLQGSMIGRADKNGPQGDGVNEDVSFTLNTCDKHAVVYAIDRESYNCGKNFVRNVGISENGVSATLNAQGPSAVATPVYQGVVFGIAWRVIGSDDVAVVKLLDHRHRSFRHTYYHTLRKIAITRNDKVLIADCSTSHKCNKHKCEGDFSTVFRRKMTCNSVRKTVICDYRKTRMPRAEAGCCTRRAGMPTLDFRRQVILWKSNSTAQVQNAKSWCRQSAKSRVKMQNISSCRPVLTTLER